MNLQHSVICHFLTFSFVDSTTLACKASADPRWSPDLWCFGLEAGTGKQTKLRPWESPFSCPNSCIFLPKLVNLRVVMGLKLDLQNLRHAVLANRQTAAGQGGTVGTTTPLPNGLVEEIIDDEMATMNWATWRVILWPQILTLCDARGKRLWWKAPIFQKGVWSCSSCISTVLNLLRMPWNSLPSTSALWKRNSLITSPAYAPANAEPTRWLLVGNAYAENVRLQWKRLPLGPCRCNATRCDSFGKGMRHEKKLGTGLLDGMEEQDASLHQVWSKKKESRFQLVMNRWHQVSSRQYAWHPLPGLATHSEFISCHCGSFFSPCLLQLGHFWSSEHKTYDCHNSSFYHLYHHFQSYQLI